MQSNNVPALLQQRYEILQLLGSGGMGTVFQARDVDTGDLVAVKMLKPDIIDQDPDIVQRFAREGDVLRTLNHPNIVKLLATMQQDGQHYLVLEYVSGGSLADLLKAQPQMPVARVLSICLELADALARAHHLKIIHRDVKPANVLLADDGTPRLTDFGIARVSDQVITQSGVVMGTFAYLAPEAFAGDTLDARADLWAFGVLLFEMLAGRRPFEGDTTSAIIGAVLTQPTPDLEALRPDSPIALVDLVYRLLTKDRAERIPSARLVGAALESIINGIDTPLRSAVRPSLAAEAQDLTYPVITALSTGSINTNLPAQTTPIVGREDELAALGDLLDSPSNRLVTIVGPGGMGKTRLSLEVGAQHTNQFADGVYFIELAPLSTPEHIVSTIADAIGVQFAAGVEPKQQLLDSFHNRKMLLIMDNFEHLLDGAPLVGEILQAAPNVSILATSRERLNLNAETLFVLSGMDFPDWETPEDALKYSAVALFMQSARRVKSDFELKADDLVYVARICRFVQGLPLGILLAAASAGMLSVKEIAQEISENFDFLETEMRDVPERQRSIRAVFDYSWQLLNEQERDSFMRLSVFRGGFTREAAQVVASATLKTLMALMNKSLLRRDLDGRYQIHELLRQYGEQRLNKAGATSATQEAHATFYAHFLQERWEDLKGRRQVGALAEIDPEFENIRSAWQWLVEKRRGRELGEAASSLWYYLDVSTLPYDGVALFRQAIEMLRSRSLPNQEKWVIGHLLGRLAWFQAVIGLKEECEANANEALTILRGERRLEETIMTLHSIGYAGLTYAQYAETEKAAEEAFRIAQDGSNEWVMRNALAYRGAGLFFTGKVAEGRNFTEKSLTLSLSAGDLLVVGYASIGLWFDAMQQHNFQDAEKFSRQSLQANETLHMRGKIAQSCIYLGASLARQDQEVEGKSYFYRGIKLSHDLGIARDTLAYMLTSIEDYFSQVNKPFAVELLAMMLSNPACDNTISGWTEKTIVVLKAELPAAAYETAWKRGEQWTLDQAVALVLAQLS